MFSITIISSAVTIIISVLALIALHMNKDESESTYWMKKALRVNLIALIIVFVTYSWCAYDVATTGITLSELFYEPAFISREFSELVVVPISMYMVEYARVIARNRPPVEEAVKSLRPVMRALGIIMAVVVTGYVIARFMGFWSLEVMNLVYYCEYAIGYASLACIGLTIFTARKELGGPRIICFVLYIFVAVLSSLIVWYTEECTLFQLGACVLLFLLIAMQSERVNMSNVESVERALEQAKTLNARLEQSMEDLVREKFLLKEISNVYNSLHIIDLEHDTYRELKPAPHRAELYSKAVKNEGNQDALWSSMDKVSNPQYTEVLRGFTNLSTLPSRMRGKKYVSLEILSDEDRWISFSFIRIGDDLEGKLGEVVFTSVDIDEEKREKERLERASKTDVLTNVYNRNAFINRCNVLDRDGIPDNLWIVVVDINCLKETNDTHGHEAGDEVIRGTARCLLEAVGTSGDVFRNGGDEFVAIVQAGYAEFAAIIDDLHASRKAWKGEFTNELMFSVGYVCSSDRKVASVSDLFRLADRHMYEDKRAFYETHAEFDRRKR